MPVASLRTVVSAQVAQGWLHSWRATYPQADGSIKLAAGWLIDQCQLKGKTIGGAAVHRQQALVLINDNRATSDDVVGLAHYVRQQVGENLMFGSSLKCASSQRTVK